MLTFNIVTACKRSHVIPILYKNLSKYINDFDISWWIIYDSYDKIFNSELGEINWIHQYNYRNPKSDGGHDQLNFALDLFDDGIFYALDDDTLMHPDFFPEITKAYEETKRTGFLFHDQLKGDQIYYARMDNIKECEVGQQNFALHRKLIGDRKYPLHYSGDGEFIEKLYKEKPEEFVFISKILAWHNRLWRVEDWQKFV